jgi:hypothetical protein
VNHRLPSGPSAISYGSLPAGRFVTVPVGVIRPIVPLSFGNQRLPSGPATIPRNSPGLTPAENRVSVPAGVTRPM